MAANGIDRRFFPERYGCQRLIALAASRGVRQGAAHGRRLVDRP
jgi:hypothetical protein